MEMEHQKTSRNVNVSSSFCFDQITGGALSSPESHKSSIVLEFCSSGG